MGVLPYYAGTGTMAEIPLNNYLLLFHYLALGQEWPYFSFREALSISRYLITLSLLYKLPSLHPTIRRSHENS